MTNDLKTFRDHFLSIYQSAVGEVGRRIEAQQLQGLQPRGAASRQWVARADLESDAAAIAQREFALSRGLQPPEEGPRPRALTARDAARFCADLAFRYLKARVSGDAQATAEVQGEITASTCDPVWVTTMEEYVKFFGPSGSRGEIPYIRPDKVGPAVIEIDATSTIALLGDWGTGAEPALQILKQVAQSRPSVLVHLGDIYYSGTPEECENNFVAPVNQILRATRPDLAVYTLSGNHDMYSGGTGYYDLIGRLNNEQQRQPASYFCLRSRDESWQLLALDTGLHDYSPFQVDDVVTWVEHDEIEWHCSRIKEFPGRTILLSHHQLFSAFSPIGTVGNSSNPYLLKAFEMMQSCGNIAAWFWGHEHTLSIYNPFKGLQRGRCLGHGAIPVSILDKIYQPLPNLDETPTIVPGTELKQQDAVYAHGYAIMQLSPEAARIDYYQDLMGRRARIYSEEIS